MFSLSLLRWLIFGALFGFFLAFSGIVFNVRKAITSGVYVPFFHLQKFPDLLKSVKFLRPHFQLPGKWGGVTSEFKSFVKKLDEIAKNPSEFTLSNQSVSDVLRLVKADSRKSLGEEVENIYNKVEKELHLLLSTTSPR